MTSGNPWWTIVVSTIVFGCVGFFGVASGRWMGDRIVPFEDGPPPGKPNERLLIGGAALLGALMSFSGWESGALLGSGALRLATFAHKGDLQLLVFAALTYGMVACWYTDVRTGIVPDVFTLGTLGLAFVVAALSGDLYHLIFAIVMAVPFAGAALLSRGLGMGWGDVKLVAIAGAALGLGAMLVLALACLVAVTIAFVRKRRSEPIAFAPYLIGAIGTALALPGFVPTLILP